LTAQEEEN